MRPRVKVCCIASVDEMSTAVECGASALGLVSAMPSGPGVIPEELIAEIAARAPPTVATFLLTCRQDAASIIEQQRRCRVNTLQLCDRVPPEVYAGLRAELPGVSLVQVVHVRGEESFEEALTVARHADALLLDSGNQSLAVKELGGTGRTHDWRVSRRIVEASPVPVFLAGGLRPENVADAVEAVRPFGLDVCSGVRTNGKLDERKLREFFKNISHRANPRPRELHKTQRISFRDQLRDARAVAMLDAEAFDAIVHVLERMGSYLRGETGEPGSLDKYRRHVLNFLKESSPDEPLFEGSGLHIKVDKLYELIRDGRNKAMHEGAFARHLADYSVEFSIILEHALMDGLKHVGDFMVRNPVCAELWQPLSFIRLNVLKNSFSYLPVSPKEKDGGEWWLISDLALSRYLHAVSGKALRERLSQDLETAIAEDESLLDKTATCAPNVEIRVVFQGLDNRPWDGKPILVLSEDSNNLIGILTPFDLL